MLDDPTPSDRQFHITHEPCIARILARFDRRRLETIAETAIELLDGADQPSDPDVPDFSPAGDNLPGCPADAEPDGDAQGDTSWPEFHTLGRHKLRVIGRSLPDEDAEDCDPREDDSADRGEFEDEPMFDAERCDTLNHLYGQGPGGGWLLDSDYGGEEAGERDE